MTDCESILVLPYSMCYELGQVELVIAQESADIDHHFNVPTSVSLPPLGSDSTYRLIMSWDILARFLFLFEVHLDLS